MVGAGILALIGCGEPDMEPMVGVELRRPMSVGVLEGDSLRTFGRITDVAVAADGSFAVLDAEARDVRWFDLDGAFRGRISRRGEGPGEFFDPDGELLWETRPEGLVERTWHLGSDGLPGHRAGDEDNPTHYGQSIVRWGPESVLTQFSTYPAPALVSVELDLRTGVERGRSADLPLFIAGTAERVWALEREPFPKLTVYEVAPVDEGR